MTNRNDYDNRNLTMLCDFYELTMANGYFLHGMKDMIAVFDYFFRTVPDQGGFAIFCGLEQFIEYIENLKFSTSDLDYLKQRGLDADFIETLRTFEFACDIWAIPEGTPVFPNEPLIRVCGPIIQAQFIETMLLLCCNHQTLIATKTNRIIRAARKRSVLEFGSRRAQGFDAANYGARAAYIAGIDGSANTFMDVHMGIPALGTMAHSWVQSFPTEMEAFCAYAETYPDNTVLLVDTYNTLKSGVPNAIRTAQEELEPLGKRLQAIRLDSGDIAYLSNRARKMLDEAGLTDCRIIASNSLDEYIIRSLLDQDACVDTFGVGENLITAKSEAILGGVYKLCGIYSADGELQPRMKISDNLEKVTNPGFKEVWRLFGRADNHPIADVITLMEETIDDSNPYEIFDPVDPTKRKIVDNFYARKLLVPIFCHGKLVYQCPTIEEIRKTCTCNIDNLWSEVKRFDNPHRYYVDLSQALWDLKNQLLMQNRRNLPPI